MAVSWQPPFPIDFDQQGDAAVKRMLDAHHPMLAVARFLASTSSARHIIHSERDVGISTNAGYGVLFLYKA
jgi:hypothetical protein